MFLPNTHKCQIDWHHCESAVGTTTDKPYAALQYGCDAASVHTLLSLLSTTDTAAWWDRMKTHEVQGFTYYTPRYWQPLVEALAHAHFDPEGLGQTNLSYNDFYCNECEKWVSKILDHEHWEVICSSCQTHRDGDDCDCCTQCGYLNSECECCSTCGEAPNWCECCSYCEQPDGYCSCDECEDCEQKVHYCQCNSGGRSDFGSSKTVPWEQREDEPFSYDLPTIKQCDNENLDPVMLAANFYLLDAIKNQVRFSDVIGARDELQSDRQRLVANDSMLSGLRVAADREYSKLVETCAPSFLAYAISAVGGELRYHKAVGSKILPSSREKAWDKFVKVVQQKGPQVLFEADTLFNEFGSSSYGGKKWGDAAKVVGQYLNGTMPAWLFVDRVFTLQHNGGCFLNKINWARRNPRRWSLSHIQYVLNAHAGKNGDGEEVGTDWDLLLAVASPSVATMFRMTERQINRLSKRYGGYLVSPKKSKTLYYT